jgi:ABC-2 type transport system permease protein
MSAVAAVRVPQRSWHSEARAVRVICRRELIRFLGDRAQILMALIQPLLFLFVLGSGLQSLSAAATDGVDLKTVIYPGILGMTVLFNAIFRAASLVWDRELGFLRELTVSPVNRSSIVLGKCLGGTIIAASQGAILLALAGLVDVPYDPAVIVGAFGLMLLLAFALAALGLLIAVSVKQAQTFTLVMQLLVMPMFFASGALYPVSGLPAWLNVLNRVDPLTYAVDPMRHLVFAHLNAPESAHRRLDPGVTWLGWRLPPSLEAAMVLGLGLAVLGAAVWRFTRTD